MTHAKFMRITAGGYETVRNLAVSLCVEIFRGSNSGTKIAVLTDSDTESEIVSKLLWKFNGFIPNTILGEKYQHFTPIIIGTRFADDSKVIINLQMNKENYTDEELSAEQIVDFTADELNESVAYCRMRYGQLKKKQIEIDYQTISLSTK